MGQTVLIYGAILLGLIVIVFAARLAYLSLLRYVKKKSVKYKALLNLNRKMPERLPELKTAVNFDTTKEFSDVTKEQLLLIAVPDHNTVVRDYVETEQLFQSEYDAFYLEELKKLPASDFDGIEERIERIAIEKGKLRRDIFRPLITVDVHCNDDQTKGKGIRYVYRYPFLKSVDARLRAGTLTRKPTREEKEKERQKITRSMRYDVLKRDDFRCTICGRGVDDGVRLQVDHICPVSKGGKTVMENLRTLCEDCNQGKADKYDENGKN